MFLQGSRKNRTSLLVITFGIVAAIAAGMVSTRMLQGAVRNAPPINDRGAMTQQCAACRTTLEACRNEVMSEFNTQGGYTVQTMNTRKNLQGLTLEQTLKRCISTYTLCTNVQCRNSGQAR